MPTESDSAGTGRRFGDTFRRQDPGLRLPSEPAASKKSWGALIPDPVELSGLTEIRVHGVGGTRPQELLGDLAPTRVAGDRIAGFYRTSDARGRHRDAYSWGGLTSHSPLRTLWLILFSSMLANMAGWTVRPRDVSTARAALREPMTWRFRWCARLAALSLTISTAVMVTMFSLDTFAYQCLAQPRCRSPLWFSSVLDFFAPYDRPGNRLAFGVIIPVAVAALFYILASVSRSSYEDVEPPAPGRDRPVSGGLCAAAQAGGLSSPKFWSGRRWHQHLSDLHLAAGIAVVAGMLGWCTSELSAAMNLPSTPALVTAGVAVLASALVIGTVLLMLSWDVAHEAAARLLLIFSIAVLFLAVLAAIRLPLQLMPGAGAAAAQTAGVLPGIRVAVNCGWGLILAGLFVLVVQQTGAWIARWFSAWTADRPVQPGWGWPAWWKRAWETARHVRTLSGPDRREFIKRVKATARGGIQVFPWAAPVVFNALALIVGNAVLLSYMVLAAQILGRAQYGFEPERPKPLGSIDDPAVLWVPPAVASVASILTLGLLATFILFAATVWTWLLWSTRKKGKKASELLEYLKGKYKEADASQTGPASEVPVPSPALQKRRQAWMFSAFGPAAAQSATDPSGPTDQTLPSPWVRRVARMEQLGKYGRMLVACLSIATAGTALVILPLFQAEVWVAGRMPMLWVELGTFIGASLPGLYVAVAQLAFRNEKWRKALLSPFDVGTFFPRSFHPFAPPSYTERAVPELSRRIWYLHDNNGRVVLTAHSQGSVVAVAVLARQSAREEDKGKTVGLVTLGSPLGKLYRWAFPSLLSDELLRTIAAGRTGIGDVCWRNVYYGTDYIGGPVGTEDWPEAHNPDLRLVDPPSHTYIFGQPMPRILSHTGYWVDSRLWEAVDSMCDRIMPRADTPRERSFDVIPPDPGAPIQYRGT